MTLPLGRKTYLSAGSHDDAQRTATLFSLTRTTGLHSVPRCPYLTDVLNKFAASWAHDRLNEPLPDRWTPGPDPTDPPLLGAT